MAKVILGQKDWRKAWVVNENKEEEDTDNHNQACFNTVSRTGGHPLDVNIVTLD